MARRRLGVYDLPLWRDWLAWVTLVAFLAVPGAVSGAHGAALAIDAAFGLVIQFLIFGYLPGKIRQAVRVRRATPVTEKSGGD